LQWIRISCIGVDYIIIMDAHSIVNHEVYPLHRRKIFRNFILSRLRHYIVFKWVSATKIRDENRGRRVMSRDVRMWDIGRAKYSRRSFMTQFYMLSSLALTPGAASDDIILLPNGRRRGVENRNIFIVRGFSAARWKTPPPSSHRTPSRPSAEASRCATFTTEKCIMT